MTNKKQNAAIGAEKKRETKESILNTLRYSNPENKRNINIPDGANSIESTIERALFYSDLYGNYSKQIMINTSSNRICFVDVDTLFTRKEQKERVLPAEFVYEPHQKFVVRMGPNGLTQVNFYQPPWWRGWCKKSCVNS